MFYKKPTWIQKIYHTHTQTQTHSQESFRYKMDIVQGYILLLFLLKIGNRSICWCQINQMVSCVGIKKCTFQQTSYNLMQFVELIYGWSVHRTHLGAFFMRLNDFVVFFLLSSICYFCYELLKHNKRSQIKKAIWTMLARLRFRFFSLLSLSLCFDYILYFH